MLPGRQQEDRPVLNAVFAQGGDLAPQSLLHLVAGEGSANQARHVRVAPQSQRQVEVRGRPEPETRPLAAEEILACRWPTFRKHLSHQKPNLSNIIA
jgi:hypothetical protein